MTNDFKNDHDQIRSGTAGFYEQKRGLTAVHGKEAVQFLNGMITNDIAKLEDGAQMLAAFPNAQGRLIAVVRVMRQGERYLFETEEATREKVFQNLFRFTFAGDFFVEDLSEQFSFFGIFGPKEDVLDPNIGERFPGSLVFETRHGADFLVPRESADSFRDFLRNENSCIEISDELYEILRVETGIPKFGVDMDETTIVPELGIEGLISYNKGCYVGQEIIARIHFRGHVAKQLTGLVVSEPSTDEDQTLAGGTELKNSEGKNAGKITSSVFSPRLGKQISLGYVRYEFLAQGTTLLAGNSVIEVKDLPFV